MKRLPLAVTSLLLASVLLVACAPEGEARLIRGQASASAASSAASAKARRAERLAEAASRHASSAPAFVGVPLTEYRVPVLVYHHVRAQEGWAKTTWSWKMTVTPETFERQMQWLEDKNYTSMTLDELTAAIRGERAMPEKPVVITFDDNNLNQYDAAVPILEKHGMRAVFYLITKYLDSPNFVNRERALELQAKGNEIESHTLTHRALPGLNDAELAWELTESKSILEELTGRPVNHVAYPGTAHNHRVRDAAKAAGFVTATIMDPRPWTQADDWMKVPRIMMTDDTDLAKVLP
jgi:peptidoglycan/xylan/chitin deacetylase (PgdA/CDA1 family)